MLEMPSIQESVLVAEPPYDEVEGNSEDVSQKEADLIIRRLKMIVNKSGIIRALAQKITYEERGKEVQGSAPPLNHFVGETNDLLSEIEDRLSTVENILTKFI